MTFNMASIYLAAAIVACVAILIPLGFSAWLIVGSRKAVAPALGYASIDTVGIWPGFSLEVARRIWAAYFGAIVVASIWVAHAIFTRDVAAQESMCALIVWIVAAAIAAAAPFQPIIGAFAYVIVSYLYPREHAVTALLLAGRADVWLTSLTVASLVIWAWRAGKWPRAPRPTTIWALMLYALWVGVVVLVTIFFNRPINQPLIDRTMRIIQCLVFCIVAYYSRPTPESTALGIVLVSLLLAVRARFLTDDLWLEQNIAALAAIMAPWAIASAFSLRRGWSCLVAAMCAICLIALVAKIANRGAFVGLACGAMAMWVVAPWRWRIATIATPLALLTALWLPQCGIGRRLDEAYKNGGFQGTAAERIGLWKFGLKLADEFPIFGVGPENYRYYLHNRYSKDLEMSSHNSFIDTAAELGYPGLLLFISVWLLATGSLVSAATRCGTSRAYPYLVAGLAGSWTFLVAGSFLSLGTLTLAYILLGVALAFGEVGCSAGGVAGLLESREIRRGDARCVRRRLDLVACFFTALILLGSLSPFDFEFVGLSAARRTFIDHIGGRVGQLSRVDVVSNIALFAPLGFVALGSLAYGVRNRAWQWAAFLLTALACTGIGTSIEYLQCWFPGRTVSRWDICAQFIGALIGALAWACLGSRLIALGRRLAWHRAALSRFQMGILFYGIGLIVWLSWPLDVSMHPRDIWHKFQSGGIRFFDASVLYAPLAGGAQSALAKAFFVAPLGWFISAAWLRPGERWRSWQEVVLASVVLALAIEIVRFLVPSQSVAGDQIVLSIVGVVLGVISHRLIAWGRGRLDLQASPRGATWYG